MSKLNKKLNNLYSHSYSLSGLRKIHSTNKDMRYWEWMYLEIDDGKIELSAVFNSGHYNMYACAVSNTMNIPTTTGKNYGKK